MMLKEQLTNNKGKSEIPSDLPLLEIENYRLDIIVYT